MTEVKHSRLCMSAVAAFVLGVSSLVLSLLTALPALYVGLRAVREINSGDGRLRGHRLAIAGLILGAAVTLVTVIGSAALVLLLAQERSQRAGCTNNLRQIGEAVHKYHDLHDNQFPAATVWNASLSPEQRLSWQAVVLPFLAENTPAGKKWAKLAGEIAFQDAWDVPANAEPRRTTVSTFLCPAFAQGFSTGQLGLTCYVGVAGVGLDAASLPLSNPQAGFFGYNRTLKEANISASLSSTMMVVETTCDNGPWIAGGPPTVRGLDPNCNQYTGYLQPFGGLHLHGLNVLWADGSVRFVDDGKPADDFRALAQINRGALQ